MLLFRVIFCKYEASLMAYMVKTSSGLPVPLGHLRSPSWSARAICALGVATSSSHFPHAYSHLYVAILGTNTPNMFRPAALSASYEVAPDLGVIPCLSPFGFPFKCFILREAVPDCSLKYDTLPFSYFFIFFLICFTIICYYTQISHIFVYCSLSLLKESAQK